VFDAGRPWIPADVLYALDHFPPGRLHLHGEAIRYPRAWLAYRLALWDGRPARHSAAGRSGTSRGTKPPMIN